MVEAELHHRVDARRGDLWREHPAAVIDHNAEREPAIAAQHSTAHAYSYS